MKTLFKSVLIMSLFIGHCYQGNAQEKLPPKGPEYFPFGPLGDTTRGIFGSDDRIEVTQALGYSDYTRATATMVDKRFIKGDKIYAYNLKENLRLRFKQANANFDTAVKFLDQPTCGNCTGFLIAPDILVTAGHCVEKIKQCEDFEWIFDYTEKLYYNESQKYITVPASNRYRCKEILAAKFGDVRSGYDYAVIRLDRPTTRKPYRFRTSGKVTSFSNVYMIGSPTGLPLKLAKNSYVVNNSYQTYFVNNLDGFPGNSGGPVFNINGFIEGIHVRGAIADQNNSGSLSGDYYYDQATNTIKNVQFSSAYGNAGSQAHRITHIPGEILLMAIYENLRYAVDNKLDDRLDEWLVYQGIFGTEYVKKQPSLLIRAIDNGNINALNKMLDKGAVLSDVDVNGMGLLHYAVKKGNKDVIETLLKKGLGANLKTTQGVSPLQLAVESGNLEVVKVLMERGGDANQADAMGNTALHYAAKINRRDIAEYLISKGADAKRTNSSGKNPGAYAKSLGFKDLSKYLKKAAK